MKDFSKSALYSDEELATAADGWMIRMDAQKLLLIRDSLEKMKYEWIARELKLLNFSGSLDDILENLEEQYNIFMALADGVNQQLLKEVTEETKKFARKRR